VALSEFLEPLHELLVRCDDSRLAVGPLDVLVSIVLEGEGKDMSDRSDGLVVLFQPAGGDLDHLVQFEVVRIPGHGFFRESQAGLVFTGLQQGPDIDLRHHGIQRVEAERQLVLGQSLIFPVQNQQEVRMESPGKGVVGIARTVARICQAVRLRTPRRTAAGDVVLAGRRPQAL
jgi:hypothetical protein